MCLGKVLWILSSVRRQTAWYEGVKILPRDGSIPKDHTLGVLSAHCIRAVQYVLRMMHQVIPSGTVPFLQGVKTACDFCKGEQSRKHCELVHGGILLLCVKASFKGMTQIPDGDPLCYLDEACRSEFMKSSARAAFQQGGVCCFSPKQQKKNKTFYFHGLQYVFLLFLFNGLQHNKSWGTKRYSEANETKTLLGSICIFSLSSIFPLWLFVQHLAVRINPEKPCRARETQEAIN